MNLLGRISAATAVVAGAGACMYGITKLAQHDRIKNSEKDDEARKRLGASGLAVVGLANSINRLGTSIGASEAIAGALSSGTSGEATASIMARIKDDAGTWSVPAGMLTGGSLVYGIAPELVSRRFKEIRNAGGGASEGNALLAVASIRSNVDAQTAVRLTRDIHAAGTWLGDAVLAESAMRHHLTAQQIREHYNEVDKASSATGTGTAILTASALDTGTSPAILGQLERTAAKESAGGWGESRAILAAASARSGIDIGALCQRHRDFDRLTNLGTITADAVVAAASATAGLGPIPLYEFAVQDWDDK